MKGKKLEGSKNGQVHLLIEQGIGSPSSDTRKNEYKGWRLVGECGHEGEKELFNVDNKKAIS